MTQEIALGVPITQAMDSMSERINSMDLSLMVTAVLIQREVGGSLAEILETIAAVSASACASREKFAPDDPGPYDRNVAGGAADFLRHDFALRDEDDGARSGIVCDAAHQHPDGTDYADDRYRDANYRLHRDNENCFYQSLK
jgi:hypothetical protein